MSNAASELLRKSNGTQDRDDSTGYGSTLQSVRPVGSYVNMREVDAHGIRASASMYDFFARSVSAQNLTNLWKGLRGKPGERLDWISLVVVYWVTLVSEAARGLVLPSQWPFLQSLGGSKAFFGMLVASFSFGRMLSTIPLGFLSDSVSMKTVLILCSMVEVLGNIIYATAESKWILLASRIIIGLGSATMSVCRAHVTRSIPRERRTYHFAYLSALQFIGFAVLPGAGGLLAALPSGNVGPLPFNSFSDVGWVLTLANGLALLLLLFFYKDPPAGVRPPPREADVEAERGSREGHGHDYTALLACLLINIAFRGVVAQLETVASPFLMEKYDFSMATSSYLISLMGFAGLIVYLSFKPISATFTDRQLVVFGLVLSSFASVILAFLSGYVNSVVYVMTLGLIWSISYPIGQTAVLGLFSKTLAGLPAGGFLGIFSAGGSFARLSFATIAGYLWSAYGRMSVFRVIVLYTSATLIFTLIVYKRLGPQPRV